MAIGHAVWSSGVQPEQRIRGGHVGATAFQRLLPGVLAARVATSPVQRTLCLQGGRARQRWQREARLTTTLAATPLCPLAAVASRQLQRTPFHPASAGSAAAPLPSDQGVAG